MRSSGRSDAVLVGAVAADARPHLTFVSGRFSAVRSLAEFSALFVLLPAAMGLAGVSPPFLLGGMFWSAVILLSMTRNFLWSDLLPKDVFSEWRLLTGCVALFAFSACLIGLVCDPQGFCAPEFSGFAFVLLFPFVVALPMELAGRALFFRRYGALFRSGREAALLSGVAGGLVYLALWDSPAVAAYGALAGYALGRVYLLTGQFALVILAHSFAGAALWLFAPGLL